MSWIGFGFNFFLSFLLISIIFSVSHFFFFFFLPYLSHFIDQNEIHLHRIAFMTNLCFVWPPFVLCVIWPVPQQAIFSWAGIQSFLAMSGKWSSREEMVEWIFRWSFLQGHFECVCLLRCFSLSESVTLWCWVHVFLFWSLDVGHLVHNFESRSDHHAVCDRRAAGRGLSRVLV